ncbi:MAG: 4Fe-4S binding protein [Endomicrobiales bacterium]
MAFQIDQEQCAGCGVCESACKTAAICIDGDKYKVEVSRCTDCGDCSEACPMSCIIGTKK